MLDTARAWLEGDGEATRQLDAMPGARAGLETAVRDVERTRVRDDCRIFERQWDEVRSGAARREGPLLYRTGYGRVAALGEALSGAESLADAQREVVDEWRATHKTELALFERARPIPA